MHIHYELKLKIYFGGWPKTPAWDETRESKVYSWKRFEHIVPGDHIRHVYNRWPYDVEISITQWMAFKCDGKTTYSGYKPFFIPEIC